MAMKKVLATEYNPLGVVFLIGLMVVLSFGFIRDLALSGQYSEKDYQKVWCEEHGGIMEYQLPDKARVDCLIDDYAVEFDWDYKWAEAIGQSLYYAAETNRRPMVVIISKDATTMDRFLLTRHIERIAKVAKRYNIEIEVMVPDDLKKR